MFLAGLGLELDDLKSLRTLGSLTPGHPEYGHTPLLLRQLHKSFRCRYS